MVRRGLFVGRFQPPHVGHCEAIKALLKEVDELVIVIGSSQFSHELNHPFTAGERMVMVREALDEMGIDPGRYYIVPVPDVETHSIWVSLVRTYAPSFEVVYSNEPLTRRLFEEAGLTVREVPFHRRELYSATEVRRRMLAGERWQSLVLKGVAGYIESIDGVERLRALTKSDKVL
jgi:nicotinamide-nucleotide adenylyltransferase